MPPDRFAALHQRPNTGPRSAIRRRNHSDDEPPVDPTLAHLAHNAMSPNTSSQVFAAAREETDLGGHQHSETSTHYHSDRPSINPISPPRSTEDESESNNGDDQSERDDPHPTGLFRSATPEHSGRASASRATQAHIRDFARAATASRLDETHRAMGLKLCDTITSQNQYVIELVNRLEMNQVIVQELKNLNRRFDIVSDRLSALEHSTTKESGEDRVKELRVWVKDTANHLVVQGGLEAYVQVVDSKGTRLNKALTNLIGDALMAKSQQWRDRVLGRSYGNRLSKGKGDSVRKLVNEKAKIARKELQRLSLMHVPSPGAESPAAEPPVPTLDNIIYLFRKTLGPPGDDVPTRDEILSGTTHASRARQALVRLHIIHWAYNRDQFPGQSQWKSLDALLEHLRGESIRYRYAHAVLVLEDDMRFDGKKTFVEIMSDLQSQDVGLETPDKARVQAVMEELEDRFGPTMAPDEGCHANPPNP